LSKFENRKKLLEKKVVVTIKNSYGLLNFLKIKFCDDKILFFFCGKVFRDFSVL